jgi:hypothetical protein
MNQAMPAFREGMLPVDVDATLCKAYGVTPERFSKGIVRPIRQIDVGAMWHGLAMDLIRGNIDQTFWGWADPHGIHLLDFWKSAVPDMVFVLVYNHPQTALAESISRLSADSDEAPDTKRAIDYWREYNEEVLRFYHRNADKCLLIHAEQLQRGLNSGQVDVRALLAAPLNLHDINLLSAPEKAAGNGVNSSGNVTVADNTTALALDNDLQSLRRSQGMQTPLTRFLTAAVFRESQDELRLYEELQAVATLPYRNGASNASVNPTEAWEYFGKILAEKANLASEISELKATAESLELKKREIETLRQTDLSEKDALLKHMMQVQEEFESHYELQLTEKQKSQQQINQIRQRQAQTQQQLVHVQNRLQTVVAENREKHPVGAADRVKEELPYKIGAKILECGRSVWKLLFLPLILWLVARKHRRTVARQGYALPWAAYDDYMEGVKAQGHLSYRLGKAWLKHIHKPWNFLVIPWALLFAYTQFRRDRKLAAKQ